MKFSDIAIGQRFELDGATYVKTSPVLASPQEGSAPRFLARYAQVTPLDGVERAAKSEAPPVLRMDEAVAAFDVFHRGCTAELARCELPAERLASLRAAIDAGRDQFLATLTRLGASKRL